ncbi:hypothetical protein [Shimia haliotis]|uniref:MetA-pathway of phenol degradation n=1 Tax=Shimia haliotis TaxID=1280847 RepID=A0A1I4GW88_9RHOB|nr:hypothetical protein [Shimia haliotis]SFL34288.1 hypothetical protein SAMN04488036_11039 [Shimia haliotis]
MVAASGFFANGEAAQSSRSYLGEDRPKRYVLDAKLLQQGDMAVSLEHAWNVNSAISHPPNYAFLSAQWGVGERWQIGVSAASLYGLQAMSGGLLSSDSVGQFGLEAKYHLGQSGDWSFALLGALEYIDWQVEVPVAGRIMTSSPAGSIHFPATYSPSENLSISASLSYAILPEYSRAGAGAGQLLSIGSNISADPEGPLRFFASYYVPIVGENRLLPSGNLVKAPIWALGGSLDVGNGWDISLAASNSDVSSASTHMLTTLRDDTFIVTLGVSKKFQK